MKTHCLRVFCVGGCWYSIKPFLSASNRAGGVPSYYDYYLGFRLGRSKL